jgi:type I restriction enzyme S subunit
MAGEWREYRIGEIADIVGGSTPSTADPSNFNGDIPWLTPKDLSGPHDRYVSRGERNLSRKGLESCSAQLLPAGTVLVTSRAPIGYAAIAKNPIATNQGFRNLIPKPGFDSEFLYYWVKAHVEELQRYASGSTFQELTGTALAQIRIRVPPLPEQRAIAHILGTLDDKIELNRRMSETLEAMARALFKAWFVDFEPVRAKMEGRWQRGQSLPGLPAHLYDLFPDRLVDSELGEIPEGWRVVELEQAIEINPPRVLRKGQRAPYLDMASMPTRGHVPLRVVERPYTSGTRFMNGDTLLARITPSLENGKTAFVDFLAPNEVGWGSTEFIVLRPKPPLPAEFGYCLARDPDFREFAIQSMTGTSGRQRVQPEALARYLLVVPSDDVAKAFGALVEPWFRKGSRSERESRTLAALRDALLPKLIRGEIRVKEVEQLVLQHVSNTQKED